MSAAVPASLISPISYQGKREIIPVVQKGLKIALTACSILSLIPPLKLAGNLATRGIALLSSGMNSAETWKRDHLVEKIVQCMKIALVILGIVALAASLPVLSIASIAADLAYNTFEVGRAIYHKDLDKALTHLTAVVIDTFALAAIATGSWELMVVAASLSAAAMVAFGIKIAVQAAETNRPLDSIDAVCHFIQAGVGIASAVMISKIENTYKSKSHYNFTNPYDKEVHIYTRDGRYLMTVQPGQTVEFERDYYDSYSLVLRVQTPDNSYKVLDIPPTKVVYQTDLIQAPIEPEDLPKLPLDPTVYPYLQAPSKKDKTNLHLAEMAAFSNPQLTPPISCRIQPEGENVQIAFTHAGKKTFNYSSLKEQIPFLNGYQWNKAEPSSDEDQMKKISLINLLNDGEEISPIVEEIFIYYLMEGDVVHLDNLAEENLLQLFYLADRLTTARLRDLAIKSIADRLNRQEWQKRGLLKEAKKNVTSLQPLLNYYDFE